jgi:uncharacterized membrane protein
MYLKNPFRMKDWRIREYLALIIAVQVVFSVFLLLDFAGLNIPIVKNIVGFIFILFVPGMLLLRLLDLDGIKHNGQVLLYTVGLSLASLMLAGFLMNTIYPLFGISKPLSFVSIFVTINVLIVILCFICYKIDKGRRYKLILRNLKDMVIKKSPPNHVNVKNLMTSQVLFPLLIPFLSVLGAYMMNVYQYNILTMLMIFLIGLMALLVGIGKINSKYYSLWVFVISFSLLLHKSLITNYIWGWDVNIEYFLANQVVANSFWDQNLPMNYNSMLSVMMMAPIFSTFINTGLIWIMKIVYPFIFSLTPLGLYYVFHKQTSPRIAFFAAFFFMIQFTFYTEMVSLIRQQVAELMLVLVLMIMVNEQMDVIKRSVLAIIFGMSIVVAHYGLAYIMMFILSVSMIFLYFIDKNPVNIFKKYLARGKLVDNEKGEINTKIKRYRSIIGNSRVIITPPFVALFILFILIWDIYTSNSTIFQSFVNIGCSIIGNLYSFMDPNATQGLSLVMQQQVTPLRNLQKNFYLISQLFIAVGIIALLFGKDGMKFKKEFKALSLAAFIVLMAGVFLPFFSSQMNTSRLYHMSLIILAPFCVIGIIKVFHLFRPVLRFKPFSKISRNNLFTVISIFLVVFLFFDTGFTYQILDRDDVTSISLSTTCDFPKFDQREVTSGEWLQKYSYNGADIYADKNRASVLNSMVSCMEIPAYFDLVNSTSYIFLGTVNIARNKVLISQMAGANIVINEGYRPPDEILSERFRIYDDGGSYIYGSAVRG